MDLHVYRNSQDRWYDLRSVARDRGAVLALNAVTLDELVERLTADLRTASPAQRLALVSAACYDLRAEDGTEISHFPNFARYAYDAINELKSARVRSAELRSADAFLLADILDHYDRTIRQCGLCDPHDRRAVAASRVSESGIPWLQRFQRVVLHALYDLTESEFLLDAVADRSVARWRSSHAFQHNRQCETHTVRRVDMAAVCAG